MVGMEFIDHITKFQVINLSGLEDFSDKFHYQYTVIILLLSTLAITTKQYVFKPISCYYPQDIGGKNLLNYLENYCWVQGTIPMTNQAQIPFTKEQWKALDDTKLLYYQWVPFALGIQCILFYLPKLMWQVICYSHLGTDLQHLVNSANQAVHSANLEAQNKMIGYIAKSIAEMSYQHREFRGNRLKNLENFKYSLTHCFFIGKRYGLRIVLIYLFHKLLYLINSIVQLYFMNRFLSHQDSNNRRISLFPLFNMHTFSDQLFRVTWHDSLIFPRVGYCVAHFYHLNGWNSITAQCVLPLNMLNERLYLFLWIWINIGFVLTLVSLPIWFYRVYLTLCTDYSYVEKYLILKDVFSKQQINKYRSTILEFEKNFMRPDGIFILRIISINTGDVIAAELIYQLWILYQDSYSKKMLKPIDIESANSPNHDLIVEFNERFNKS